jgi:hypothetical protein
MVRRVQRHRHGAKHTYFVSDSAVFWSSQSGGDLSAREAEWSTDKLQTILLERTGTVTDVETRDLNKSAIRAEPIAPNLPSARSRSSAAPSAAKARGSIFAADVPQGADALGQAAALRPLAELVAHRDAETPLTIGLLGGPGSGKSFALAGLLGDVEALSAAADETMVRRIEIVRIDAASLDGAPSVALAAVVYDKLGVAYPEFVREAAHAVRDPHVVAREAAQRLDDARRRLDAERQSLEEIENRRGRLTEAVLFESAGSQVDAYARTNRGKIESRLANFSITGDPIANYKSMVRDLAHAGGAIGRISAALRAFWTFAGQGKLLATAIVLFLAGIAFDMAVSTHDVWLASLTNSGKGFVPLATWLGAHIGALSFAAKLAYLGAAVALAANILRGVMFLNPLFHGVSLLKADVANRRQALDQLYAHQTRRVDGLEADVDLAARAVAEADRRAGNAMRGAVQNEPSPFKESAARPQAERFFASLASYLLGAQKAAAGSPSGALSVPDRIVVALDNVGTVPQAQALAVLEAAHRAFAHPGFVSVIAADPARLGDDASLIDKWVQLPFRVDCGAATRDYAGFVEQVIGRAGSAGAPAKKPLTPNHDWSISADESALLAALAPLAGGTPRAVKRFVNLYRIARSDAGPNKGTLALFLALFSGGSPDEIGALRRALVWRDDSAPLDLSGGGARLTQSLDAAQSVDGLVTVGAARRTAAIARAFSTNAGV